MLWSSATSFNLVFDSRGKAGRGIIAGISTVLVTSGTPEQVMNNTREAIEAGGKSL